MILKEHLILSVQSDIFNFNHYLLIIYAYTYIECMVLNVRIIQQIYLNLFKG